MIASKALDTRRRRGVSTTDRGACRASGAVGQPSHPTHTSRQAAERAQPRNAPAQDFPGIALAIVFPQLRALRGLLLVERGAPGPTAPIAPQSPQSVVETAPAPRA